MNPVSQDLTRRETPSWHDAYRSDVLAGRRLATHGKKLERLGILQAPPSNRILDVCCGEGEMLDILYKRGFKAVTGLDVAADATGIRMMRVKPWSYVAGSATDFPFEEASFDWVICAHSLHHLWPSENIEALIANAHRVLKPGGKLALVDHFDSVQMRTALALILSPLALVSSWSRAFRAQHLEEKDQLYGYLNDWPKVRQLLENNAFKNHSLRKGLFFFYYVAEK